MTYPDIASIIQNTILEQRKQLNECFWEMRRLNDERVIAAQHLEYLRQCASVYSNISSSLKEDYEQRAVVQHKKLEEFNAQLDEVENTFHRALWGDELHKASGMLGKHTIWE